MYKWSNAIGRYASNTRFVEVYMDVDADGLSASDYRGVYVVMEKIEQGKDRVNIEKLGESDNAEPEVTGGFSSQERLD